jgi:glycosyltransferase involved in cell wall biosynthesis
MRIAIAGIIGKKITSHPLGGTEAFTYLLIDGLVKKGHEVTLYSCEGSQTVAQHHVDICKPEEASTIASNVEFIYPYTLIEIKKIISDINQNKFDILHINIPKTFMFSFFAEEIKIPIVHTMHRDFFVNPKIYNFYKQIGIHKNENFVFVSKNAFDRSLNKTNGHYIFNGINISKYPFAPKNGSDDYLLWLSRMDPDKGAKEAILTAKSLNKKLILTGDIDRKIFQDYFDQEIVPLLDKNIVFEKQLSLEKNISLFQQAKVFIFPVQWEEPCPLTVFETMATGTPIVTYARGSLPELVKDGLTGFIVNPSDQDIRGDFIIKKTGIEGLKEAINKIYSMPETDYKKMRQNCRTHVEKNFTVERMVDEYEKLYQEIIEKNK